jgi:ferrous iron transport protein A
MMLTDLDSNDSARITTIEGGHGLRQQLALRGIAEGCTLKIISCSCGPVVVEMKGCTIALGRGMAQKIRVMRLDGC